MSDKTPAQIAFQLQEKQRELPIHNYKSQIIYLLTRNNFIIVVGETGSGKSTQIPQYLLDAPDFIETCYGEGRASIRIGVTQPRRVAAISMARRVSEERGSKVGKEVGYTIRFDDTSGSDTLIRYITDGCLLRECLHSSNLAKYDVLILDEAHERSMHTDVLFALVKRAVVERRGELRVVVTSATLDTKQFSEYFNDCPVLEVPGRCFAVEVYYAPTNTSKRVESAVNAALRIHTLDSECDDGHVLVFLTGKEECELACTLAHSKLTQLVKTGAEVLDAMILPLYGALSSEQQHVAFTEVNPGCRKIIFTTNIAETSLTVDGVGFVVDCGYVKQKCFNPKNGMDSLQTVQISQVQADQRKGRAGRTHAGKCFRLYSEDSYNRFQEITTPEILRVNLSSVLLQLKDMGIEDVLHFDFMEPPDTPGILQSLKQLYFLDALDMDGHITQVGRKMAEFPLDPNFSKALLQSVELDVPRDMVNLVALLSAESVWFRPSKQDPDALKRADKVQRGFFDPSGDHMTLLNVYDQWRLEGHDQDWCKENYLHRRALKQTQEISEQISQIMETLHLPTDQPRLSAKKRSVALRKGLAEGFFMQTARPCHTQENVWITLGEAVMARPDIGSALAVDNNPLGPQSENPSLCWLVYSELGGGGHIGVLRNVSIIEREWIEPFLPKMSDVDMRRLTGHQAAPKADTPIESKQEAEDKRRRKISEAQNKYFERKKKLKVV
eukprot:Platyproteum_vivax@DN4463_c0_g1_i1.p1